MSTVLIHHLAVVCGVAFAATVAVAGYRRRRSPAGFFLIGVALIIVVGIIALNRDVVADLVTGPRDYPDSSVLITIGSFVGAAVAGAIVADALLVRLPGLVRPGVRTPVLVATVSLAALAIVFAVDRIEDEAEATAAPTAALPGVVDASYPLPAGPLDIAMDSDTSGYLSAHPDKIYRFDLANAELALSVVTEGLDLPRGIAIAGDQLIVALTGPVLCPDPAALACRPDLSPVDAELSHISSSSASVVSLQILADGSLGEPRTLISGLPTTWFDHGLNAVDAGPDGRIYASLGGVSDLALFPAEAARIDHPRADLIGTIISFQPDGTDLQVFARGIRNVYDLAFAPDGTMYTADNDGEALNALRREEILRVTPGAHFGYPVDGTFEPFTQRDEGTTWILDHVGSSGVAWVDLGGRQGIAIGALSSVSFAEFGERAGAEAPLIGSRNAVSKLVVFSGYGTTVDQLSDGRLLVGVFSPWDPSLNQLLIVSVPG